MLAMPALTMALLEQNGICDMIDSLIKPDPQRILKPGKCVKVLVGAMFQGLGRRPMYRIDQDFECAPVALLCGEGVTWRNLNPRAISRTLDDLFGLDLPALTKRIYDRFCRRFGLESFVYNMDSTNFGVYAVKVVRDRTGACIPEFNGHPKDGRKRKVYSLQTVTDSNGIVCYERPYDGSAADSVMDMDTVDFLAEDVEDTARVTLVADCKLVNTPLVEHVCSKGFGFVSKCPARFGGKKRDEIAAIAEEDGMAPSAFREGWGIYDTDSEVDGVSYRFVAFSVPDRERGIDYLREQGGKEAAKHFKAFEKRTYSCFADAQADFDRAQESMRPSAYLVSGNIVSFEVKEKYGKKGRPPKDWVAETHTMYRVDVEMRFSEEIADEMSGDREERVLISNLPRSCTDHPNPRDGVTADGLLKLYLGQYAVEHAFRTGKSQFDLDVVYIHRPSRANAFMSVVSLATMIAGLITAVMKKAGIEKTGEMMMEDLHLLNVVVDSETGGLCLRGSKRDQFMQYLNILGIDEDKLFSC